MPAAVPFALLALVVPLVVRMPWRRPHPNHEFIFQMLRVLEDTNVEVAKGLSRDVRAH